MSSRLSLKTIRPIRNGLISALVFTTVVFSQSIAPAQTAPSPLKDSATVAASPINQAAIEVDSVSIPVSDMDRAVEFYTHVLSFQSVSDVEVWGTEYEKLKGVFGVRMRIVKMRLGDEKIELIEYLTPKGKPIPIDSRSHDRWFQHIAIVVNDMDRAYQQLRRDKVQHASTAPQRLPDWNKAAAGIRAFYFKDPDGHNLEIIYFPVGKGNPKWQKPSNQLFLGIDHTAIVVSNTARSLGFYRDLLGLRLAGESINYGTEQAHLNNVEGAKLHISGLQAASGLGVEFLEYLQPKDGRPYPADARANDLLSWQTTFRVKNIRAIASLLKTHSIVHISPEVVTLPNQSLGFQKGILVRDPDGHLIRLIEPI